MKHRSRQGVRTGRCRAEQGRGGIVASQGRVDPRVAQRQFSGGQQAVRQVFRRDRRSVQFCALVKLGGKQCLTENTSVYDHDSDLGSSLGENAVFNARGYRPIEERVKKVRLRHGRDRKRTSVCMAAGHSRDNIL